jgi:hypothetical protein
LLSRGGWRHRHSWAQRALTAVNHTIKLCMKSLSAGLATLRGAKITPKERELLVRLEPSDLTRHIVRRHKVHLIRCRERNSLRICNEDLSVSRKLFVNS